MAVDNLDGKPRAQIDMGAFPGSATCSVLLSAYDPTSPLHGCFASPFGHGANVLRLRSLGADRVSRLPRTAFRVGGTNASHPGEI